MALLAQLRGINVFLKAAAGTNFVGEFVEAGCICTLLEVLLLDDMLSIDAEASKKREADVIECLTALQCVAKAGRPFKEEICASGGVAACVQVSEPCCASKPWFEKLR